MKMKVMTGEGHCQWPEPLQLGMTLILIIEKSMITT